MIIRNPINPYPQNITVDPNEAFVSFVFSGDRLGSYRLKIYSYSNLEPEQLVYESDIINIENYAYNNEEISINTSLLEMNATSGKSYTWMVEMSPFKNLGEGISTEFNFISLRYFFESSSKPYIISTPDSKNGAGFLVNDEEFLYSPETNMSIIRIENLQNRSLDIEGYYSNGNIKYYHFELFDEDENLIEKTNKTFSSKIEYNFSGFLSSKNYILRFYSVSQKEQYVNIVFNISVAYTQKTDINYPPVLVCNENEATVKIKWINDSTSVGVATGEYEINEETGEVDIISGTIVYNDISSFPILMDKNNFAVGVKTTINNNTTKIFDYVNNNILYEIYVENYKIFLKYGEIGLTNKTIAELGNLKTNILFGIQDYAAPVEDTGYMWYDDNVNQVSNSESEYILISKEEEKKYSIILQNNNGEVSCQVEPIN